MKLPQQILPQDDSCLKLLWQAYSAPDSDYHGPPLAPDFQQCQQLLQQVQLVLPDDHVLPNTGLAYVEKVLQQVCVPDSTEQLLLQVHTGLGSDLALQQPAHAAVAV